MTRYCKFVKSGLFLLAMCLVFSNAQAQESATEYVRNGIKLLHMEKHQEQAIVEFNKAIKLVPTYAEAYNLRGDAYRDERKYDQAILDYNKALELNPNSAGAYAGRGSAYGRKKNYTQAISDYNKTIELGSYRQRWLAYYDRGGTYYHQGKYTQAILDYSKVIELNSNFIEAYIGRGDAYKREGKYAQAISDYSKAIELRPNFPCVGNTYTRRAGAYYSLQEYDKAWNDVHKAESLGYQDILRGFIKDLKKASGRDK